MGGQISFGGLASGLDTESIIQQLVGLERQPIFRLQDQVAQLERERDAISNVRNTLLDLRNRIQDFRLLDPFGDFTTADSDEEVLTSTVSGANPVAGSFTIDVQQLASATSASSSNRLGATIDPNAALDSSGLNGDIEDGTFTINGQTFTFDAATDSLNDLINDINTNPNVGVTASFDAVTDTVTFENSTPGDTSLINFGAGDDESNILALLNVEGATQFTNASGSTEVTSTRNLGAVRPSENLQDISFANGAVTAGTFSINGVAITIDPATDSISDVIAAINESDAQVTASFDAATDRITFNSEVLGSRTINFGSGSDTSNFLSVTNLDTASQTAGNDAQFTVNGGPVQTRNTNEVRDAIGGVTLDLLSTGTSTVTVNNDNNGLVEQVQAFVDQFNSATSELRNLTAGENAVLSNDASLRQIENFLRQNIFNRVSGLGDFDSLAAIGITTGSEFNASEAPTLELDSEVFLEALGEDRSNIAELFTNGEETGILDQLFSFVDEATRSTGFLNDRVESNGSIDRQIESINSQIDRVEDRVANTEERLRREFLQLEQLTASFQNQASALAGLGGGGF